MIIIILCITSIFIIIIILQVFRLACGCCGYFRSELACAGAVVATTDAICTTSDCSGGWLLMVLWERVGRRSWKKGGSGRGVGK